jgi:hypothetical protein
MIGGMHGGPGGRSVTLMAANVACAGAVVLIFVTCATAAASESVRPGDTRSTRAYLRADEALSNAELADIPAQKTAARNLLRAVSAECPNIVGHHPTSKRRLDEIDGEIFGALGVAAQSIERTAISGFAARVVRLRWSNRALTRSVAEYAKELKVDAALPPPKLCADMRSWVSGGYHELPPTARRFLAQFRGGYGFPSSDDPILFDLRRYEGSKLRALARPVEKSRLKIESVQLDLTSGSAAELAPALGSPPPPG